MESLEVVARPHFEKSDHDWLVEIRSRRTGNPGPPYFTLVFSGLDLTPAAFADEVRARAAEVPRVRFHLRSALVAPEPLVRRYHVFLIPDEGFAAILKLHDALHAGALEAALRPETPYLPHITVATTVDYAAARKIAGSLNHAGIDIPGHIDALAVERRAGQVIRQVAEIPLAKSGWFG